MPSVDDDQALGALLKQIREALTTSGGEYTAIPIDKHLLQDLTGAGERVIRLLDEAHKELGDVKLELENNRIGAGQAYAGIDPRIVA